MKVADNVLAVLAMSETDGNRLVLPRQLDRKLYTDVNKVLIAAGGRWIRGYQAHVFEGDAAERIEQVLLSGDVTTVQDLNYFPTPAWLAGKMARLAHVGVGDRVLEPSAGRGAIVNVLADLGADVEAVEKHEPFAKELADQGRCRVQHVGDFLQLDALASKPIDAVVMNPPFVKQADLHHVRHALRFLRPGGTLVSVMSNGVMFRDNRLTADFRDMVTERGGYFESLPEDSFRDSGTGVRTVLVVIPG